MLYCGVNTQCAKEELTMNTERVIEIKQSKRRIEAAGADLSGSTFTDVSLSGATFTDAIFQAR